MLWVSNDSALPFAFDTCSIRVPYLHWLSIRVRYVFVLAFDSCPLCVRVCVSALCDRRVTRYPKLRAASAAFEAHTRTHTHTHTITPASRERGCRRRASRAQGKRFPVCVLTERCVRDNALG